MGRPALPCDTCGLTLHGRHRIDRPGGTHSEQRGCHLVHDVDPKLRGVARGCQANAGRGPRPTCGSACRTDAESRLPSPGGLSPRLAAGGTWAGGLLDVSPDSSTPPLLPAPFLNPISTRPRPPPPVRTGGDPAASFARTPVWAGSSAGLEAKGSSHARITGSQAWDELHDLPEASSVRGDPARGLGEPEGTRCASRSAAFRSACGGSRGTRVWPPRPEHCPPHRPVSLDPPRAPGGQGRAPEQMVFRLQGPRARGQAGVTGRLGTLDPAAR